MKNIRKKNFLTTLLWKKRKKKKISWTLSARHGDTHLPLCKVHGHLSSPAALRDSPSRPGSMGHTCDYSPQWVMPISLPLLGGMSGKTSESWLKLRDSDQGKDRLAWDLAWRQSRGGSPGLPPLSLQLFGLQHMVSRSAPWRHPWEKLPAQQRVIKAGNSGK